MYFPRSSSSIASALLVVAAQATYLNNELSFGHNDRISPTLRSVPNFHLIGTPMPPEILSNKLVLTPPAPGNQRGGVWAVKPLEHSLWSVDVDFRATGPERGVGNLQIWYAKDGQTTIGTGSIYTVGRFDGLAIVIDQYAGSGGFIRGFLNDGTKEYFTHHAVDSLAFGHCTYAYRNRGQPSRLTLQQSSTSFKLTVDGTVCFESTNIKLPIGYNFGISAASAEEPDSIEVFKFVTTTESHTPDVHDQNSNQQQQQNFQGARSEQKQDNTYNQIPGGGQDIPAFSDPPEVPASSVSGSAEQFADLHNRLQAMMKHMNTINRDLIYYQNQAAGRHQELTSLLSSLTSSSIPQIHNQISTIQGVPDTLRQVDSKLQRVQDDVRQTKNDLHNALDQHVSQLRNEVRDTHHSMLGSLAGLGFGIGKYLFVVLGSQAITVGAYLLYKKRKNGGPKKYL